MLRIRPALVEDAGAASLVLCASIRELCKHDHHDDPDIIERWLANKTTERVAKLISSSQEIVLMAERDSH